MGYLTKTNEIFIGVDSKEDQDIQLFVNNDFSTAFTHLKNIPVSIDTNSKNLIEGMSVNYQSQNIFATVETVDTIDSRISYKVFTDPDVSVSLADYIDLSNIESVFL